MEAAGDYPGFEDTVSADVANSYRRLRANESLQPVFEKLKRQGLDDHDIEILLRRIALLPQEWRSGSESVGRRAKRRAAMAKKLRALAGQAATDPDLRGLYLSGNAIAYDCPPDGREGGEGLRSFAEILDIGASLMEEPDEDGPERKMALQTFALRGIFELLEPHYKRAPNKEAEALGAALLQTEVKPGTLTQLRKSERRKYYKG